MLKIICYLFTKRGNNIIDINKSKDQDILRNINTKFQKVAHNQGLSEIATCLKSDSLST